MADAFGGRLGRVAPHRRRPAGRRSGWPRLLADDPPLLVWAVCRAGQADFSCRSVGDAAGWLAEHALEVLQWPAGHDRRR